MDEAEMEEAGAQARLLRADGLYSACSGDSVNVCLLYRTRRECERNCGALLMRLALQADREWYDQEEGGIVDETHNPFLGDNQTFAKREAELQKKLVGERNTLLFSQRHA